MIVELVVEHWYSRRVVSRLIVSPFVFQNKHCTYMCTRFIIVNRLISSPLKLYIYIYVLYIYIYMLYIYIYISVIYIYIWGSLRGTQVQHSVILSLPYSSVHVDEIGDHLSNKRQIHLYQWCGIQKKFWSFRIRFPNIYISYLSIIARFIRIVPATEVD